jgi:hypothetical protein
MNIILWNNKLWQDIVLDKIERQKHLHVLWMTWTWKSTLLYNMIMQDINNNLWVIVVDIHGDLVNNIINKIPKNREKDLLVFYPADRETLKNIFDLEQVFLEWKILVCNLSYGQFWEIISNSFINILLENINQWLEKSLNNIKETYIYIDEFQKFQRKTMLEIIFKSWYYYKNIWIIFAHQYLGQLTDEVFDLNSNKISFEDYVLKIIENKIIFNIWKFDIEELWPKYSDLDLLQKYEFIAFMWSNQEKWFINYIENSEDIILANKRLKNNKTNYVSFEDMAKKHNINL